MEQIGPYKLVRRIGSGATGVVFEAVDEQRALRVALKTLATVAPGAIHQLKSEFRSVASVQHANLVRLYELMESDGTWFFTMELLEGQQLAEYVAGVAAGDPHLPAPIATVRAIVLQLALGLDALHRHELLHLDVKPANIVIEPDGRAVLLDFGLVLRPEPGRRPNRATHLHGTPRYMAPEQLIGRPIGPTTDWYALGLILYELLTGEPARGDDPWESMEGEAVIVRASARRAGVPEDLDALCADLLQDDPAKRPAGSEVIARLGGEGRSPEAPPRVLVGRRAQLEVLREAAAAVAASTEMVVVHVIGAAGAGKSALVNDFVDGVRASRDAVVLAGRCYEWESLPYKGLDSIIDGLCELLAAMPARDRERIPLDGLDEVAVLFPVLRRFVPVSRVIPASGGGAVDRAERRARAFRSLKRVLRAVSELRPLVCFIDDVHWGDADSARLLIELLSPPDAPRMLLVLAYRGDDARRSEFLAELDAARDHHGAVGERRITLEPLTEHDAADLARTLLQGRGDPARWDAIARESGGNPFFIEELVRRGRPAFDRGGRFALEDVVRDRLDQLSDDARRVLEVIAVAGRLDEQDLALAAAGARGDPHRLLATLRAASMIRTRGPRRTDSVEPYHDRIRDCVIAGLTAPALASVHGSIASTLEGRPGIEPHTLSVHFEGAGQLGRARSYAIEAATRADAALAFDRAAAQYARALALGDDRSADASQLHEQHGRALWNAGRGALAGPAYLAAAAQRDGVAARELRRQAVEAYLVAGRLREGIATLKPLAAEVGLRYHDSDLRSMLSVVGQLVRLRLGGLEPPARPVPAADSAFEIDLCWAVGRGLGSIRPAQGIDFFLRGLLRAIRLGEPRRLARALTMQGTALVGIGGPVRSLGEACLARAAELADQTGDPYLRAIQLVFRGFSEVAGAGRWPLAISQAEQGMKLLREHCTGVSWEIDMAMGVKLKAFEPSGDVRALGESAVEWSRDATDRGDLYSQNVAVSFTIPYRLALDDIDGARAQARRPLVDWTDVGYTVQHYHATRLEAHCDLYCGRAADAWDRLRREQAAMKKLNLYRLALSRIEVQVLEAVIRLSLAASDVDRGAHLRAALRLAGSLGGEARSDGKPHAAMIRGVAAAIRGDRDRGGALLEDARARYDGAAMPQWSWAVTRRLGELRGDAAMIGAANQWFVARGVMDPDRWVAQLVPRIGGTAVHPRA